MGKIYDGTVTSVKEYGAFVALEGVAGRREGLVHVSNMANPNGGRVENPNDIVKRFQKIKVCLHSIFNCFNSLFIYSQRSEFLSPHWFALFIILHLSSLTIPLLPV